MLELKLLDKESFYEELMKLNDFRIESDDKLAKEYKKKFVNKINLNSKNIVITTENIDTKLQEYINLSDGCIIARKGKHFYKENPLFLVSIPKAGTHLLSKLFESFGYKAGHTCPVYPKGGYWYFIENSNSHTEAKSFFNESVYRSDFGNRDHPFVTSPTVFIYRNPLDIVTSEANYYHKEGKTSFAGYLNNLEFSDRLQKLINDKWLLGSIEDRISKFIAWLFFDNVISVSFEELIGEEGGGTKELQTKLIWSLQLKLQIPGVPTQYSKKVFDETSDTFFNGQIGGYKTSFNDAHYDEFNKLNQDFMNELGYSYDSSFSSKIEYFRDKKFFYNKDLKYPQFIKEANYLGYYIQKYNYKFYGAPKKNGSIDIHNCINNPDVFIEDNLEFLKYKISLKVDSEK